MANISRSAARRPELFAAAATKWSARHQAVIRRLRTFPKVAALERVEALKLHGAFFEIEDARLLALDEARDEFVQIAAPAHEATIAQARF